jgi:hypothetical protein
MRHGHTDRRGSWTFALAALVALGGATAIAEQPAKGDRAEQAEEGKGPSAKVYTNQDLPPEPSPDARTYTNQDLPQAEPEPAAQGGSEQVFTNDDLARMFPEPATPEPAPEATPEPAPDAGPAPQGDAGEGGGDGSSELTAPAPPPPEQPAENDDPLAQIEAAQRASEARDRLIREAEAALAAAREKVEQLEVQLLAVSNPFSARPQLSEEEQEIRRTSGEDAVARRARTEQLVEEAKRDVASLETRLEELRRQ